MKVKTDTGTFDVPEITFKARRQLHQLEVKAITKEGEIDTCLLYTSPSPRDVEESRMPSSA